MIWFTPTLSQKKEDKKHDYIEEGKQIMYIMGFLDNKSLHKINKLELHYRIPKHLQVDVKFDSLLETTLHANCRHPKKEKVNCCCDSKRVSYEDIKIVQIMWL